MWSPNTANTFIPFIVMVGSYVFHFNFLFFFFFRSTALSDVWVTWPGAHYNALANINWNVILLIIISFVLSMCLCISVYTWRVGQNDSTEKKEKHVSCRMQKSIAKYNSRENTVKRFIFLFFEINSENKMFEFYRSGWFIRAVDHITSWVVLGKFSKNVIY